jgi:hypothetical protein
MCVTVSGSTCSYDRRVDRTQHVSGPRQHREKRRTSAIFRAVLRLPCDPHDSCSPCSSRCFMKLWRLTRFHETHGRGLSRAPLLIAIVAAVAVPLVAPWLASRVAAQAGPILLDRNLSVRAAVSGLTTPTSVAFLGPNDMLVTEKETGLVRRVQNGRGGRDAGSRPCCQLCVRTRTARHHPSPRLRVEPLCVPLLDLFGPAPCGSFHALGHRMRRHASARSRYRRHSCGAAPWQPRRSNSFGTTRC